MAARKSTSTTTTLTDDMEAPALREVPKTLAEVTSGEQSQAWFEDKVVRAVRDSRYCGEALAIMDKAFGAPLDKVGVYDIHGYYGNGTGSDRSGLLYYAYLDSDGVDCWGNMWRDRNGCDRAGFDMDGRDKDGYNKDGRDLLGFDREGKDANGVHRDDPARFQYDRRGYNRDGYNRDGYDRNGYNREGKDASGNPKPTPPVEFYVFDANGYDADGWNCRGGNAKGGYSQEADRKYATLRNNS